jgi:hypothetical protein
MARTKTGSRLSIKLNGVKVAFATDFTVNHENQLQDVDVLDQLEVAEHAEVGHKVNSTLNIFKVDENAASLFGFDPLDIDSLLSQPELTLEVYDRENDNVIYEITGVKFEGGSGSVNARGIWTGTWNFRGRRGRGL